MWPRNFSPFWSCVNLQIMAKKINPNNYEEIKTFKGLERGFLAREDLTQIVLHFENL